MFKRLRIRIFVVLFPVLSVSLLSGCSDLKRLDQPVQALAFDEYRNQTIRHLQDERTFTQKNTQEELQWNIPQEWRPRSDSPRTKPERGILLVHGLGDSPWSFHDIAPILSDQGFLVRTVLLPGHGTRPDDLMRVTAEQWQRVVHEQTQELAKDVAGDVYLGGFSTGANLILEYAYGHSEIGGLVLFSPGFKSSVPFEWLTPLLSEIRPWLFATSDDVSVQTPVRYMNVPTNGYAQYYRTSKLAQKLLENPYDKPVFMTVAQHDSVLDTDYLLDIFLRSFVNPKSRLVWYGDQPENLTDTQRILIRADRLPEFNISQFSHMGLLFSPDNPLYGNQGSLKMCFNSLDEVERTACESADEVWLAAWGYQEEGKIHARLTFNPYLTWQMSVIASVLEQ